MVPDLRLVIQLHDLDHRIDALRREIASLPKHIAEIAKTLEAHTRKLEADRAALAANKRDRNQLELDIQAQEQRIAKLKGQMSGSKVSNEQYAAFKREIDFCEAAIRKHEDRILDRMSESEPLEQNLKAAEAALQAEKQVVEAEKQRARERTAADQKDLDELQKQRQQVVAPMTLEVYSAYERIRKKRKGVAVAEAVDGRCSACHLALRLQFFQDLRKCDQVMFCESCGRILYYNPPAEVEDLGSGPASEPRPLETGP